MLAGAVLGGLVFGGRQPRMQPQQIQVQQQPLMVAQPAMAMPMQQAQPMMVQQGQVRSVARQTSPRVCFPSPNARSVRTRRSPSGCGSR